ncbi:MAG TPA: DUF4397 domain-containing protein [Chitinophagaceae bacterium]|nr:DUF4397 domain-containing protein [Chitinophagaceae bacterium]
MIRKFLSRKSVIVFSSVLLIAVLFSACKKDTNDMSQSPVSALMAFNLAPDQPQVSIALSGNLIGGAPLAYGSFTGAYLNIYSGNRRVDAYGSGSQLLDSLTYPFEQNKYYSVFVTGADGNYKNIVALDNYDSLKASSGMAYVRYVNAIPGSASSNVTISSSGSNVVNTSAGFGQVSSFTEVTPGELSISVSNENAVNASRTITVAGQKAYTVLLMGQPNQADSTRAVQIRFIENGSLTD